MFIIYQFLLRKPRMKLALRVAAVVLGGFAISAQAESSESYTVQLPPGVKAKDLVIKSAAGASFGSPMGFGASWGQAGIGAYSQTIDGPSDDVDGAVGFAFGLGDAKKIVGLEIGMGLSSLWGDSNSPDGLGDNGAFSAKLHKQLPGAASIAIGATGWGRWGDHNDSRETSYYVVGTKVFRVGHHVLVANLGAGNRFYNQSTGSQGSLNTTSDNLNALGSLAFYLSPQFSVIADYTGNVLNVGASVAPLKQYPLTITVGAINTTERLDGDVEFGLMASYGFSF